jgi:hypothetical protein
MGLANARLWVEVQVGQARFFAIVYRLPKPSDHPAHR